jgi:hypothetical protein
LTIQSDKLPALSGLAQVMIHNDAGTYLAGLWSTNLQSDLLLVRKWRYPAKTLAGPILVLGVDGRWRNSFSV